MKKEPFVYLDGRFLAVSQAGFDVVRLTGKGVFETLRSYDGHTFALDRHFKRLMSSCVLLGLVSPGETELSCAIMELLKKNRLKNARIRLAVFAKARRCHVFVSCLKLSFQRAGKNGFKAVIITAPRRKITPLNRIKSLKRTFYERLDRLALKQGGDEAIFLNDRGDVVEGTRTNIFLVKDGRLYTPALASGCLNGITRALVIELADRLGVAVRQGRIHPAFLKKAEEIFLTNAVRGIMPVVRLDGKKVGSGEPGEITLDLVKRYKNMIEKQCKKR